MWAAAVVLATLVPGLVFYALLRLMPGEDRPRWRIWLANHLDPHMAYAHENVQALMERLYAPLVGRVPYAGTDPRPQIAATLDIGALMARRDQRR